MTTALSSLLFLFYPSTPSPVVSTMPAVRWLQRTWNLETMLPTEYKMDRKLEISNMNVKELKRKKISPKLGFNS